MRAIRPPFLSDGHTVSIRIRARREARSSPRETAAARTAERLRASSQLLTRLVGVSNDAVTLFGTGLMTLVRRVAPSLPLYVAATALPGSALAVSWWAERDERIW